MDKEINAKKVKDIIHSIGLLNNLTDDEVRKIVESQFRFTYETIKKMSFENLTDDEIDNLRKTFYYKYLGKLFTSSDVIKRQKNRELILKERRENGTRES